MESCSRPLVAIAGPLEGLYGVVMSGRMEDLRTLLSGDREYLGMDLMGDIEGDLEGDLVGDLLGWSPGYGGQGNNTGRSALMKLRQNGPAHLNPSEVAWMRQNFGRMQAMVNQFQQGAVPVRNAPPLFNRVPGVPQTTQSRAFQPFVAQGGANSGTPVLTFTSVVGTQGALVAMPQRPVRLHNIVADVSYQPAVAEADPTTTFVTAFLIGQTSMFASSGGIPLSMFFAQVFNSTIQGVSAGPGVSIEINLNSIGSLVAGAAKRITIGAFADQII